MKWTLSAMTSKSKSFGDSWGTLYGRPMKGLVFCYDRYEEITIYLDEGCVLSSNGNACVLLIFVIPNTAQNNVTFNMFHQICIMIP